MAGAVLLALAQTLGDCARVEAGLAAYSAVGVGGPADVLIIARDQATLVKAVRLAQEASVPWRVFGGLTNILLPDTGLRGVVILNRARAARFEPEYRLHMEAGGIVVKVTREAVRRGWGGLTWAVGLPGTLGGAVVNNAGAFGGEVAGTLIEADILMPDGKVKAVGPDWFEFTYRYSRLKGGEQSQHVVLSATFQLKPRDPARLAQKATEYIQRRQRTQPLGKTLGSTFKNPPGDYAGRLMEAAGLKHTHVGGFVISSKHANFFINTGKGTAADYRALIALAQERVQAQFGVHLEPEIEILPEDISM